MRKILSRFRSFLNNSRSRLRKKPSGGMNHFTVTSESEWDGVSPILHYDRKDASLVAGELYDSMSDAAKVRAQYRLDHPDVHI